MKRLAVLTSGGDSPGMNAAVASAARYARHKGIHLIGIIRGYNGIIRHDQKMMDAFFANAEKVLDSEGTKDEKELLKEARRAIETRVDDAQTPDISPLLVKYRGKLSLEESFDAFLETYHDYGSDYVELSLDTILDITGQPGTYLRTARCDDFRIAVVRLRAAINLTAAGIEGLIVIGGDGSYQGAAKLCEQGIPCVGIPGTIDNDLNYTDKTLGYDTALNLCMEAVMEVRATSRSHDRPHVVEVMGRNCGDIAAWTAQATGAEIVIVREKKWRVDEVVAHMQRLINEGNTRATVIISEGAYASMAKFDLHAYLKREYEKENRTLKEEKKKRLPGEVEMNARYLAEVIRYACKPNREVTKASDKYVEARATVLGYTQRGSIPSAYDAIFAYEAGVMAVDKLMAGEQNLAIGIKKGAVKAFKFEDVFLKQKKNGPYEKRRLRATAALVKKINSR